MGDFDNLLADPDYHRLIELNSENRLLFVTEGVGEVRISRLLRWFFDPYQGHGLGDRGVRSLLAALWNSLDEEWKGDYEFISPSLVKAMSFSDLCVASELQAEGRLDLAIFSVANNLAIFIENKVKSNQAPGQLRRYRKALDKRYKSFNRVYVYLDAAEADPEDGEWFVQSYDWMFDCVRGLKRSGIYSIESLAALEQAVEYLSHCWSFDNEDLHGEKDDLYDKVIEGYPSLIKSVKEVVPQVEDVIRSREPGLCLERFQHPQLWRELMDRYSAPERQFKDVLFEVKRVFGHDLRWRAPRSEKNRKFNSRLIPGKISLQAMMMIGSIGALGL